MPRAKVPHCRPTLIAINLFQDNAELSADEEHVTVQYPELFLHPQMLLGPHLVATVALMTQTPRLAMKTVLIHAEMPAPAVRPHNQRASKVVVLVRVTILQTKPVKQLVPTLAEIRAPVPRSEL